MRQVSARLSDDAARGWQLYCARLGVSFTALMEAWGNWLIENEETTDPVAIAESTPHVREQARMIDATRRFRSLREEDL